MFTGSASSFFQNEISELRPSTAMKIWHAIESMFIFIIQVQKLRVLPPPQKKKNSGAKNVQNSEQFRTTAE